MSTAEPSVAVVGLGAMGLAACRELARRGAKVIGLERHELGHAFGSSHGGTRVIRLAYFEHADYVPLLQRSMDLFVTLGEASGEPVLERCGVLVAGSEESVAVSASAASADRHGIEVEALDRAALEARFPAFRDEDGFGEASPQRGLFEPGGGFVRPERTMKALAELAQRDGAELRDGCEVEGWSARDDGIEIAFSDPSSCLSCRIASRKGSDSMSPTVPPISTITRSTSSAASFTQRLISSVTCGITCTVPPR